jgi:hypothetical protein
MPRFSEKSHFFTFFRTFLKNPKNPINIQSNLQKSHFLKI